MSSLLSGPSSINPWIEATVFRALTRGPFEISAKESRAKIAQVLARGGPGWNAHVLQENDDESRCDCPSYLVLQDGKTSIVAFLTHTQSGALPNVTKGCLARVSCWNTSLLKHCATNHFEHLLQRGDPAAAFLALGPLCLQVNQVEVLGAQGMGIVGNPVDVHRSIDVRRAMHSITHTRKASLARILHLTPSLGNVDKLLQAAKYPLDGSPSLLDTLLAMALEPTERVVGSSGLTNGVILGNVEELLSICRDGGMGNNGAKEWVDLQNLIALVQDSPSLSTLPRIPKNPPFHVEASSTPTRISDAPVVDVARAENDNSQSNILMNQVASYAIAGQSMADDFERSQVGESQLMLDSECELPLAATVEEDTSFMDTSKTADLDVHGAVETARDRASAPCIQKEGTNPGAGTDTIAQGSTCEDSEGDDEGKGISDMLVSETQSDCGSHPESTTLVRPRKHRIEEAHEIRAAKRTALVTQEYISKVDRDSETLAPKVVNDEKATETEGGPGSLLRYVMRQARGGASKITFHKKPTHPPPVHTVGFRRIRKALALQNGHT